MANSGDWHGHVLRREVGHVLRRALVFEVEGERKNRNWKMTWKKRVFEESITVGLIRDDAC